MRQALAILALAAACGEEGVARPARLAYLMPAIFRPSCATASCHAGDAPVAGLAFDVSPAEVRRVLLDNSLVYAGEPEGSPLLNFLRGEDVPRRMPPDGPLPEADIALVEAWIVAGAPE